MIGSLAFLNPWALAALAALPALYFLLRITPPSPKVVPFPAARFLKDLKPKQHTPDHTPWWILLLRMLIAALLILALAKPVLNPETALADKGALVLVLDNGWGAAQNWDDIQSAAENEIKQAGRQGREIYVLATAPEPGPQPFQTPGALAHSDALSYVRGLKPRPWPSDLKAARMVLPDVRGYALWLSDGVESAGWKAFVKALRGYSALSVYTPEAAALPLALKPPEGFQAEPSILLNGYAGMSAPVRLQLLDERGQILDEITLETAGQKMPLEGVFDLPATLQSRAASFRIAGQKHAGARYDLDHTGGPKTVGIAAPEEASQTGQLTEDSFYLVKALEPYATILQGTLEDLLEQSPSVIILPDIGTMAPDTLNTLSAWVDAGGLLLRFAGPNMAQSRERDVLVPLALRPETRSVQGSLSWGKPLKVKPLAPESPLYGLDVDEDIEVSEQILPALDGTMDDKVWAALEDGTPLVTGAQQGSGLLVMVHTSASPAWSNMPLSGFYVQLLKRLLKFAGQSGEALNTQGGLLQPMQIMDGFGTLQSPEAYVKPLNAAAFENVMAAPEHPPGFYGRGGMQRALNLGDHLDTLRALKPAEGAEMKTYGRAFETDLVPVLVTTAFLLFMLDALVMLMLSGAVFRRFQRQAGALCVLALFAAAPCAPAAAQNEADAQDLYLAYIRTGSPIIDSTSQKGLEVLAAALSTRTSAEPKGVRGVDVEKDALVFYPLLYWPVSAGQDAPSSKALQNLQNYLDHGGTILVDTRDGQGGGVHLKRVLGGLNIPPLTELPKNHVLSKSFYLLESFPGRYENAPLWVEGASACGRDGVSSVILGSHDWAGAWAELNIIQRGSRQYIQGADRRHELSLRFGVNLVMYALTGNYKADQVHVPYILERLGQDKRGPR
ncbi:MAG: DUF4159 domain-containing protein [Alphaproteobacteria bacterium]